MPSFRWSAVNPGGDVARGVMEAPDRAAVVERLQRQGQIVLRADLAAGRGGWADLLQIELGRTRGLDKTSLGEVTRELAIMLAAGQDLERALRFVVENTRNARARLILGNVRDKVRSGSSLAAALAAEPRSFSRLYVGLVRAGEAGGTLPATLDRLATLLERERSLSANLRSAMIYPALLIVAALGIAKDALGILAAAAAVEAAALGAKGGGGLARPLAAAGLFPARTIHLLQLGEEAAQLSSMALKAADIHDEQARLMMQRLVALAVPMITIGMGLAVAGIVSALLTAMLSLNDLAV